MESLCTKVDRLSYSTIEREIASHFDMGYVDSIIEGEKQYGK